MDPNTISPPPQNNSPLFSSPSLPGLPDVPAQNPKNSKSKLIIIAVVILIIIVVVALGGIFLSSKNSSSNTVQQVPTFNATSETVVLSEQFFNYLAEDKLDEAVAMIQPEGTQTKQEFVDRVTTINYVKENYSIAGCQTQGSTSGNTVVVYTCKSVGGKEINVQITARNKDGKVVLSSVSIISETSNS